MSYNAPALKKCQETTKNRLIPLEENRKKIVFRNDAGELVRKVKVDGCAITQGKKCDWLLVDSRQVEYFVELKGTSVLEGCEQLEATIPQLSEDPQGSSKHSFVICGRVAPQITTRLQRQKLRFKKQFNSTLTIKQNQHTVKL